IAISKPVVLSCVPVQSRIIVNFSQSTKATSAGTSAYVLTLSIKTQRRASLVLKRFAHLNDLLQPNPALLAKACEAPLPPLLRAQLVRSRRGHDSRAFAAYRQGLC